VGFIRTDSLVPFSGDLPVIFTYLLVRCSLSIVGLICCALKMYFTNTVLLHSDLLNDGHTPLQIAHLFCPLLLTLKVFSSVSCLHAWSIVQVYGEISKLFSQLRSLRPTRLERNMRKSLSSSINIYYGEWQVRKSAQQPQRSTSDFHANCRSLHSILVAHHVTVPQKLGWSKALDGMNLR